MKKFGYSDLEQQFINSEKKVNFMVMGSLILFPYEDAVNFLTECKNNNRKVLGIDGFRIIGDKIQPDQEHTSEDYDDVPIELAFERALFFLGNREKVGLWFEIVTDTDE